MDPEAMAFIWEDVQYLTHQYVFYTHGRNLCDFLKSEHNEINLHLQSQRHHRNLTLQHQ